jgi:hypothetical protein
VIVVLTAVPKKSVEMRRIQGEQSPSTVDMMAGAIFGNDLSLKNTLIAYNEALLVSNSSATHDDEGGNMQYPGGSKCL